MEREKFWRPGPPPAGGWRFREEGEAIEFMRGFMEFLEERKRELLRIRWGEIARVAGEFVFAAACLVALYFLFVAAQFVTEAKYEGTQAPNYATVSDAELSRMASQIRELDHRVKAIEAGRIYGGGHLRFTGAGK